MLRSVLFTLYALHHVTIIANFEHVKQMLISIFKMYPRKYKHHGNLMPIIMHLKIKFFLHNWKFSKF